RATISRSPTAKLTSSTACRVPPASAPPILKCLVRWSARSRSVMSALFPAACCNGLTGPLRQGKECSRRLLHLARAREPLFRGYRLRGLRGVQQAADADVVAVEKLRRGGLALRHLRGAARREPAPVRDDR